MLSLALLASLAVSSNTTMDAGAAPSEHLSDHELRAVAGATIGSVVGVAGCVGGTVFLLSREPIKNAEGSPFIISLSAGCIPAAAAFGALAATGTMQPGGEDGFAALGAGVGTLGGAVAGGMVGAAVSNVLPFRDDATRTTIVLANMLAAIPFGAAVGAAIGAREE